MSDFESQFFKSPDELVEAKCRAWTNVEPKRKRLDIVRKFTNMLDTMTDEEAEELNRTEITNHGQTYRAMQQQETLFTSMVTGTNALLEIIVDTDNPESDLTQGAEMTRILNEGAIHRRGKFLNFWSKAGGEIVIAGGIPATQTEKYGWLPSLRMDMFFPKGTSLDSEEITYAFDPTELTHDDLKKFEATARGTDGQIIKQKSVKALLKALEAQIKDNTKDSGGHGEATSKSVRDDKGQLATSISAWYYYEVKYDDKGDQYVSSTLFTDGFGTLNLPSTSKKNSGCAAQVIAYWEKAYDSAADWLHMISVDSEIGGVKDMDTLRGVAEIIYPSAAEMEELLNLILEGDKIRAKPRLQVGEGANMDDIMKWNAGQDTFVPTGLAEFEFRTSSQGLQTPLAQLGANAAGIAASSVANTGRDGELRQQAVERQENSAMLSSKRLSEAYIHLDAVLETVVWRLLMAPTKAGTEGYNEIRWVRAQLERAGVPYKELAKREFGRFKFLKVRAKRTMGNGSRAQQLETSEWLMANIMAYPPATRPSIIYAATLLRTQDPDFAKSVVRPPQAIINAQKITAENEADTIRRRAPSGWVMPVSPEDIHQDHIPIHLLDMQAVLAGNDVVPWNKRDLIEFAGLAQHTIDHIFILLSNPATAGEAKVFQQDYQNLVAAAAPIAERLQEEEGSEFNQLTAKEQADIELKWAQHQLDAAKFGFQVEGQKSLQQSRAARETISRRSQYAKEVDSDRRLKLDAARVVQQGEQQRDK